MELEARLEPTFFARDALAVARALVGTYLVHADGAAPPRAVRIVETEAYRGPTDGACHARVGLTQRTRTLYGPPGHAYVFLIYGMYDCFNVVCCGEGRGHAVLVRAGEPIAGIPEGVRTDGPGRLARALGVTRAHDGEDLRGGRLWIAPRAPAGEDRDHAAGRCRLRGRDRRRAVALPRSHELARLAPEPAHDRPRPGDGLALKSTGSPYLFRARLRWSVMTLATSLRSTWHGFLETYEPLRPDLYRYCRHLTRSPWDAEDLAQDAMARAFVTLGQMGEAPPNPRAWLFRVASNLWLDRLRRARREVPLGEREEREEGAAPSDPVAAREAAATLLGQLSPQERAAVVLKEAFDLSLEEIAEALSTSVGAVKAALHRGLGKLVEPPQEAPRAPAPAVLDAFCAAFNAGDIDRLTALLLDTAAVQVVGATTQYGPEAARRTVLWGMLFGSRVMAEAAENGRMDARFVQGVLPSAPRVEIVAHRGEWILLHWYAHEDGEAVRAITRVEADAAGDRVAFVQNYFFEPDFVAEVCAELGVPWKSNGYRWSLPKE